MARPRPPPPDAVAMLPTLFQVGAHVLTIAVRTDWRWTVKVDGVPLDSSFDTQVIAWEAGVREAARADASRGG